ncbi:MAG TPA: ATP-binding protein [Frankiaceae bacterium]|nr:ATP-binding protein [Frankiaceae bacterium]
MSHSTLALTASAFDALPSECAVLTPDGVILAVNRAWRWFGDQNDAGARCGVGTNYLQVTDRAAAAGDDVASVASSALAAVFSGDAPRALLDYPCHSPEQERWFRLGAEPMPGRHDVLVVHTDITQQVREGLRLQGWDGAGRGTSGVQLLTSGALPERSGRLAELAVPPALSEVPGGRRFVRFVLAEWGYVSEEEAGSLLVTELLANVVLHAGTSAMVALYEAAGSVVLSVTDGSPLLPIMAGISDSTSGGRGLRLVRLYSTRHGVQLNESGKTIWAVLSTHVTEPEDSAAALAEWGDSFGS